jgi:hypothetical protein
MTGGPGAEGTPQPFIDEERARGQDESGLGELERRALLAWVGDGNGAAGDIGWPFAKQVVRGSARNLAMSNGWPRACCGHAWHEPTQPGARPEVFIALPDEGDSRPKCQAATPSARPQTRNHRSQHRTCHRSAVRSTGPQGLTSPPNTRASASSPPATLRRPAPMPKATPAGSRVRASSSMAPPRVWSPVVPPRTQ